MIMQYIKPTKPTTAKELAAILQKLMKSAMPDRADEFLPMSAAPMKRTKRPTHASGPARQPRRLSIKERRVLSLAEVLASRQAAA